MPGKIPWETNCAEMQLFGAISAKQKLDNFCLKNSYRLKNFNNKFTNQSTIKK